MDALNSERDRPPTDLTQLRERVEAVRALVYGSNANFSASQVITDLQQLLHEARARSDAQPELRQVLILMGVVECKRGEAAKARDLLRAGLGIDAGKSVDLNQLTRDHYFLASVASDLKDFQSAAEHYGKAAELAKTAPGFDTNQRLGIREKHGFALCEARRFAEAYEINSALLTDAERHFGVDDHHLSTVLINTAQNLYALGRLAEAERYLQRCLAMFRARDDIEREQDLLYQLAVLASEQGRPTAARVYLTERVKRLEKLGTTKLLEAARRGLEHFDRHHASSPQAAPPDP
jgi:tetratricopeptide (TPR) repeat protein